MKQMREFEWTADWAAVSDCVRILRFPLSYVTAGRDEAVCRVATAGGEGFCVHIQSTYGERASSRMSRLDDLDELIVVYKGRCVYGNVIKQKFVALDDIGIFSELYFLSPTSCVIVGNLGYCFTKGIDDLELSRHPYDSLVSTRLNDDQVLLTYEDHRFDTHTLAIPTDE